MAEVKTRIADLELLYETSQEVKDTKTYLDSNRTAYEEINAQLTAAKERLKVYNNDIALTNAQSLVDALQANVNAQKAQLEKAQKSYNKYQEVLDDEKAMYYIF